MEACSGNDVCHVLVAEDDPSNRLLIMAILGYTPCRVTAVETGLEALKAIEALDFDLVLMDAHMPEMDGLEATKRIRLLEGRQRRDAHVIVGVTASAMVDQIQQCIDAGMDAVLIKPIAVSDLVGLVDNACKRRTMCTEISNPVIR